MLLKLWVGAQTVKAGDGQIDPPGQILQEGIARAGFWIDNGPAAHRILFGAAAQKLHVTVQALNVLFHLADTAADKLCGNIEACSIGITQTTARPVTRSAVGAGIPLLAFLDRLVGG